MSLDTAPWAAPGTDRRQRRHPLDAAWVAAGAAAEASAVEIRPIEDIGVLQQVQRLYERVWRTGPTGTPVTADMLRAMAKAGSYVCGAFDGDELVGACFGFFGPPARRALHSHIAGVDRSVVGRSVGFALKLHQRAWAMQRGAEDITWTFDPLIRRNAHFNLAKLAASAVEYLPSFYGSMDDAINRADDTDRLLVRWRLSSYDVVAACERRGSAFPAPRPGGASTPGAASPDGTAPDGTASGAAAPDGTAPGAAAPEGSLRTAGARPVLEASLSGRPIPHPIRGGTVLVGVPPDIEALRLSDPAVAADWRLALRDALGELMAEGARVTGFDRAGWYVVDRQENR